MQSKSIKTIYVTGTDTGVGKTVITGFIARYFCQKGLKVATQKWVQTGNSKFSSDIRFHIKMMEQNNAFVSYSFPQAVSPHLASSISGKRIDPQKIIRNFNYLSANFDFVIIEGSGGALVPYNKKKLLIDIVSMLKLPVLVVAQNKLGAINHTLLTMEALKARKLKVIGIVFNNLKGQQRIVLDDNLGVIRRLAQEEILGVLDWNIPLEKAYKRFLPVAKNIFEVVSHG